MFIKSLFTPKSENSDVLGFGKITDAKHNGEQCSKITLKSGTTAKYEILKTATHPGLIPVHKLSAHSVYTKKLSQFVHDRKKAEYNKYTALQLKDAVEFVHRELKKELGSITIESIMMDSAGRAILCDFEHLRDFTDGGEDDRQLEQLTMRLAGHKPHEIHGISGIFDVVFRLDGKFLTKCKPEEKLAIYDRILLDKGMLPAVTIGYLFWLVLEDAQNDECKDYKVSVVEFLRTLDEVLFFSSTEKLFAVLDTTIRNCILRTFMKRQYSSAEMDQIAPNLCLGLLVKDKTTKKLSIDFVFQHDFGQDTMVFLLENMCGSIDAETAGQICQYLVEQDVSYAHQAVFKLLSQLLSAKTNQSAVYQCIDKYIQCIDKVKIAKEMLPVLCAKLIEREGQEQCFALVGKILDYLRSHREDIQGKEWSLKSMIFGRKKDQKNRYDERVTRYSKEEDEWGGFD